MWFMGDFIHLISSRCCSRGSTVLEATWGDSVWGRDENLKWKQIRKHLASTFSRFILPWKFLELEQLETAEIIGSRSAEKSSARRVRILGRWGGRAIKQLRQFVFFFRLLHLKSNCVTRFSAQSFSPLLPKSCRRLLFYGTELLLPCKRSKWTGKLREFLKSHRFEPGTPKSFSKNKPSFLLKLRDLFISIASLCFFFVTYCTESTILRHVITHIIIVIIITYLFTYLLTYINITTDSISTFYCVSFFRPYAQHLRKNAYTKLNFLQKTGEIFTLSLNGSMSVFGLMTNLLSYRAFASLKLHFFLGSDLIAYRL